jgi:hypothetical protein
MMNLTFQHEKKPNVIAKTCRYCKMDVVFNLGYLMAFDDHKHQTPIAWIVTHAFRVYSQIISHHIRHLKDV